MTNIANSITGGTVAIEDGKKAAEEFAPARKVKVELSFSVPEGGDSQKYLDGVTLVAQNKLNELLGKKPATATAVVAPAEPAAPAKPETAAAKKKREAAEAAEAAKNAPQKTKAELAAEKGLPATDTVHKTPASDDELLEDEPTITAAGKTVAAADPDELDELGLGDAAPAPITDLELGKAAQEKNAKMKAEHGEKWAPAKIRDLIATASGNKRINDIPAAERAKFLKDLEALKA